MVENDLLQKSLFQSIKNRIPQYFTGITLDFSETQVQDETFSYPAVRVMITDQNPIGTGTDRLKLSDGYFIVRVYAEQRSSYMANTIAGVIANKIFNRQIDGTDLGGNRHHHVDRIDLVNQKNAIRMTERLWMAEIYFQCLITAYNDIGST